MKTILVIVAIAAVVALILSGCTKLAYVKDNCVWDGSVLTCGENEQEETE